MIYDVSNSYLDKTIFQIYIMYPTVILLMILGHLICIGGILVTWFVDECCWLGPSQMCYRYCQACLSVKGG